MISNNTKKKVLFLITKSNWGGAQRYVYDLATHLDYNQFEPVVALGGNGELDTMLKHAGVRVINLQKLKNTSSLSQAWQAGQELYQVVKKERPDVFHINSSVAGLLGTIVGRIAHLPRIIFTAHGWAFNENRPWWQKFIFKCLHWITVILSHRTIAVSGAIVRNLNWPGVKTKMKVLHPGRTIGVMYETKEAREKIIDFFPSLSAHKNDLWLVSVAELHPIKNFDVLIESIAKLPPQKQNYKLVIIGKGKEKDYLEKLIKDYKLNEKVFLIGALPEAARFFKAFDIFILCSRSEAYGYVIHEAGLANLPVIATKVGGIPEIVTDNKSGLLIPPNDIPALQKAITLLLNNKTLREDLAQHHHQNMTDKTLEKMIKATETLYTL